MSTPVLEKVVHVIGSRKKTGALELGLRVSAFRMRSTNCRARHDMRQIIATDHTDRRTRSGEARKDDTDNQVKIAATSAQYLVVGGKRTG